MAIPSVGGETSTSLATQNADAVAFTGGTIAGVTLTGGAYNGTVGATTPSTVAATTVTATGAIKANSGTAPGAGSALSVGLTTSSTANLGIFFGTGAPSFAAGKGSLYSATDATTTTTRLYVNTDGSTTWSAFTSAA